jgi:hypothetical protein
MTTVVLNGQATLPTADIPSKVKFTTNGVFFTGSTTLTVTGNVSVIYYVVGGGGGGGKGSSSTVGKGGGCGAVGYGILTLDTLYAGAYTITVGAGGTGSTGAANSVGTNGSNTQIIKNSLTITAPGGKGDGTASSAASQSGISSSSSFTSKTGDAAPVSGSTFFGKGGVDLFVGANIPASGGTEGSLNGANGITIGSGGGGGYGSGSGGSGKSGAVILLLSSNDNLVNQIEYNLREMNQLPGTKIEQYNQQFSATMMAGAMWTVLATSLLFYVFTQV